MTRERIEKAVAVINYAIKNNITVKDASIACGYAGTYVKNVKGVLLDKYENNAIEDEDFSYFMSSYEEYEKAKKGVSVDDEESETPNKSSEQVKFEENEKETTAQWKAKFGMNNYPTHIKTLDQLLEATDVDKEVWRVKNYLVNKWDVTSWKQGFPETEQNFQVKAWLERREEQYKFKVAAELFREMVQDYQPPELKLYPTLKQNVLEKFLKEKNLFEINIFDLHIGKLCWGQETNENYDVKIASERFMNSLEELIYRSSTFKPTEIIFPIGNDFFNSDTLENTTTKGTRQDEDLRWKKTFRVGCRLLIDGINLMKQLGVPVTVLVIPGNHDFQRSYYLGEYLSAWFNNDSQVTINNSPSTRKYFRYGEVLLGFTHGDEEKESSLPMLMASEKESKQHWTDTTFHEWHLGHNHRMRTAKYTVLDKQKQLDEEHGVIIRYLSSLAGTDEWHYKKGFTLQQKGSNGFIWNYDSGLIAELKTNIKL